MCLVCGGAIPLPHPTTIAAEVVYLTALLTAVNAYSIYYLLRLTTIGKKLKIKVQNLFGNLKSSSAKPRQTDHFSKDQSSKTQK